MAGHFAVAAAGERHDGGAYLAGVIHGAEDVGRAAAGGDAHEGVYFRKTMVDQILTAEGRTVLRAFDRLQKGGGAAGDEPDDQIRRDAVGRRAFGGIQHAQTAGGSGADVEQPTAAAELPLDEIDAAGDFRQHQGHRFGTAVILLIDEADHFLRREPVDIRRGGIALLGIQFVQFFHGFHLISLFRRIAGGLIS